VKFRLTGHWLELANQWLDVSRQFSWLDSTKSWLWLDSTKSKNLYDSDSTKITRTHHWEILGGFVLTSKQSNVI